jgi:hypothetical protein
MTVTAKRTPLVEAGRFLAREADTGASEYRVVLISEGLGSSGYYPPEFFNEENASALANALSFPGHPQDSWRPDLRDPLSAIGWIDNSVSVETLTEDVMGEERSFKALVSKYHVAESRPDVATYLAEFGSRLGLSIFIEGTGDWDSESGTFIVKSLDGSDPYKAVDLVVAAGRGGKFLQAEAALRRLAMESGAPGEKASAPAEEVKEMKMTVEEKIDALSGAIESLTGKIDAFVAAESAKATADAQHQQEQTSVESRLEQFAADSTLINEAGLTESQKAEAMELAKSSDVKSGDVQAFVEKAKKMLEEARQGFVASEDKGNTGGYTMTRVGGSTTTEGARIGESLRGFGKVR